jgi:hypothetical protein
VTTRSRSIAALFNASQLDDDDFYFLVADAVGEGVQYGHRDVVCEQMLGA